MKKLGKFCTVGHELTKENTWVTPGSGQRCCRICITIKNQAYYQKNKEEILRKQKGYSQKWRKENPEKYKLAEKKRFNCGVHKDTHRHRLWTKEEIEFMLSFSGTRRELGKLINRSMRSIGRKRWEVKNNKQKENVEQSRKYLKENTQKVNQSRQKIRNANKPLEKKRRLKPWKAEEDEKLFNFSGPDKELSKLLERSVQAISCRRVRLQKRKKVS